MRTIFSPSISYSILDIVDEEIEVMVAQMMVEETNGSPSENIQQSTKTRTPNKMQEEGDEGNVDASLKIPEATVSVYKMLDWVIEGGWLHIPRKRSKEDATEEANNSNIVNKVFGRELFKLFLQSPKHIKTNILLKLPSTIVA